MNRNGELVQIVIPCFNGEAYLEETLISIQNQTHANFDCLLVDDGSIDNSSVIFSTFAQNDSRFRLLRNNENKGESFSVNRGWLERKGNLICILSCDDPQPIDWLSTMCTFRNSNPGHLVYYPNRTVINDEGLLTRKDNLYDWSCNLLENDLICVVSVGAIIDTSHLPSAFEPRCINVAYPSDLIQYLKLSRFGTGIRNPNYFGVWREHKKAKSSDSRMQLAQEFASGMKSFLNSEPYFRHVISESIILSRIIGILRQEMSFVSSCKIGFGIFVKNFNALSLNPIKIFTIFTRFKIRKLKLYIE